MNKLQAYLYWVESNKEDRKWFVLATSKLQAISCFSTHFNTTIDELEQREIAGYEIVNPLPFLLPFIPDVEMLKDWGFEVIRYETPIMVKAPTLELFIGGAAKEQRYKWWQDSLNIFWKKKGQLN